MSGSPDPAGVLAALDEFSRSFAAPLFEAFPELIPQAEIRGGVLEVYWDPAQRDEDVKLFVSTDDCEVTIGFGVWHTHFDWPLLVEEPTVLDDPLQLLAGLRSGSLRTEDWFLDGRWTRSSLLEPGEEPDLSGARPGHRIRVNSWSGQADLVVEIGAGTHDSPADSP